MLVSIMILAKNNDKLMDNSMSFLNTNKIGYHYLTQKNPLMSEISEEKLKELRESIRSTIDWVSYSQWIAEGEPYEEHEEVLLFLNQHKQENEFAYSKPDGKSIYFKIYLICIHAYY